MRGNRSSIKQQGFDLLDNMFMLGKGTSKHQDKLADRKEKTEDGPYKGKIYSSSTCLDYKKGWNGFCRTMKGCGYKYNGHTPRTLEECIGFVPVYIEILKGRPGSKQGTLMSAWTIRLRFSAVAKVLGLSARDYDLPARHVADIRRSREVAARDAHFSEENNNDLVTFCCCTGLRNKKELQQVKGTDLIYPEQREDGRYAIHVRRGKGGKERESVIYGTEEEVKRVVEIMIAAGDNRVWPHVHSAADIHHYRSIYAQRIYDAIARDPRTLPFPERYCCRRDAKGVWYDKQAMEYVSRQMGHNRVSVIALHYLNRAK